MGYVLATALIATVACLAAMSYEQDATVKQVCKVQGGSILDNEDNFYCMQNYKPLWVMPR
jgi:hypothetical protein